MSDEVKEIFNVLYVIDDEGKAHEISKIEDIPDMGYDGDGMQSFNFEGHIEFTIDNNYTETDISDIKNEISTKLEKIEYETYMAMYGLQGCASLRTREEKEKYAHRLNNIRIKENVRLLLELRDTLDDYVDYLNNLFCDEAEAYISDPIELN